jgi:Sec-independent protein translocase protein TatA
MGEDDSSTLMLGAMCWLLGEEKAKKLARSVGKVSGEYKRTLRDIEIGLSEKKIVPDVEKLAKGLAIDTEDKSKQEILAGIRAKMMEGPYDHVDPFEDPRRFVPTSSSTETTETETTETETTETETTETETTETETTETDEESPPEEESKPIQ